jgi:hypothetical protein
MCIAAFGSAVCSGYVSTRSSVLREYADNRLDKESLGECGTLLISYTVSLESGSLESGGGGGGDGSSCLVVSSCCVWNGSAGNSNDLGVAVTGVAVIGVIGVTVVVEAGVVVDILPTGFLEMAILVEGAPSVATDDGDESLLGGSGGSGLLAGLKTVLADGLLCEAESEGRRGRSLAGAGKSGGVDDDVDTAVVGRVAGATGGGGKASWGIGTDGRALEKRDLPALGG